MGENKQTNLMHLLKEKANEVNENNKNLLMAIKQLEQAKISLIEQLIKNNEKIEFMYEQELDEDNLNEIIRVVEYKKDEKIKIWTNIIPPNIYVNETYKNYKKEKECIEKTISSVLRDIHDKYDACIIRYNIYINKYKYDVDNFIVKLYTDIIVRNNVVDDDDSNRVEIFLSGMKRAVEGIEITIYNKEYINKYINEIFS